MNDSHLIRFYYDGSENVYDVEGRTFEGIMSLSDKKLEDCHSFVQWLFPLPEKSGCYKDAPVLIKEDIEDFHKYSRLQDNMRRAFFKMLHFYGFDCLCAENGIEVFKSLDFAKKSKNWLTPDNHNFLRITRILRSLFLCGLKEEALAFHKALENIYENGNPIFTRIFERPGFPDIDEDFDGEKRIRFEPHSSSKRPAISKETMDYWNKAVENPNYRPHRKEK